MTWPRGDVRELPNPRLHARLLRYQSLAELERKALRARRKNYNPGEKRWQQEDVDFHNRMIGHAPLFWDGANWWPA